MLGQKLLAPFALARNTEVDAKFVFRVEISRVVPSDHLRLGVPLVRVLDGLELSVLKAFFHQIELVQGFTIGDLRS